MKTFSRSLATRCSVAALALTAGLAHAQPVLELHSLLSPDLSASGNKAVGYVFDAQIEAYRVFVWERGVGYTAIPNVDYAVEPVFGSNDLSILATGAKNLTNWANLNCFNGYCTQSDGSCTLGAPLPPLNPCIIPNIAHRYTTSGGWQNLGSLPRVLDAATNRFFGGTRCDSSINSVGDISGDGRYVVGGAWTSPLFRSSGAIDFGQCGNLEAYISDATLGTVTRLPVQADNAGDSRADYTNNDGSVITGYDFGPVESEFGTFNARRICVWTNGVQTLIDDISGFGDGFPVNGSGTTIAGVPSSEFIVQTFGGTDAELVRWTRQPNNTWTPARHGKLIDLVVGDETKPLRGFAVRGVSDDGATVIGTASYGTGFFDRTNRAFIWRQNINGGVPIDLQTYLASVAPSSPIIAPGLNINQAFDISADGNAIAVQLEDGRTDCADPDNALITGLNGVLYLNGGTCNAPVIGLPPRSNNSVQYTPFGVALNVTVSGTWPLSFQWQKQDPQAQWQNLIDACAGFDFGAEWDFQATTKGQLRIGQATCGNGRDGNYRVIASNGCGSATSSAAAVTFQQGTTINQQPTPQTTCPTRGAFFSAVAVSNSAEIPTTWEIALASSPASFVSLTDGPNTLPDGRTAEVFGSTGQFLGITPAGTPTATPSSYLMRAQFDSPCGGATSAVVAFNVDGACPLVCDSIDFNGDGLFPADNDLVDFFSVLAGGPCSPGNTCNDIDFNNDGLFPDDTDLVAFLRVLAGGTCE